MTTLHLQPDCSVPRVNLQHNAAASCTDLAACKTAYYSQKLKCYGSLPDKLCNITSGAALSPCHQNTQCCADEVRICLGSLLLQHNILTSKLDRLWVRYEEVQHVSWRVDPEQHPVRACHKCIALLKSPGLVHKAADTGPV